MRTLVVVVVLAAALTVGFFRWALELQSRATPLEWKGKHVVVTGASSGIGKEMALQLARKGAHLLLVARRESVLQQVRQACLDAGAASVVLVVGDLSNKVGTENAIESVQYNWKQIDALILNHGMTSVKPFSKWDEGDLANSEQIMFLNFHSCVRMVHALRSRIIKGGSIAAVGSLTGIVGPPNRAAYAPSKFALRAFFQVMHHDMLNEDIYWTYLAPGYVRTEIHDRLSGVQRQDLSSFMTASECAEQSLDAIARGRREYRYQWMWLFLLPFEGIGSASGMLDGFVRYKANQGVAYNSDKQ